MKTKNLLIILVGIIFLIIIGLALYILIRQPFIPFFVTTPCETNEDCVERFGEGYVCNEKKCMATGLEEECRYDLDCVKKWSKNWICVKKWSKPAECHPISKIGSWVDSYSGKTLSLTPYCKPICWAIGLRSEGWYNCRISKLLISGQCRGHEAVWIPES